MLRVTTRCTPFFSRVGRVDQKRFNEHERNQLVNAAPPPAEISSSLRLITSTFGYITPGPKGPARVQTVRGCAICERS
jgi:hypothetical protein